MRAHMNTVANHSAASPIALTCFRNDSVSTPASECIFETSEVMHNKAIDISSNADIAIANSQLARISLSIGLIEDICMHRKTKQIEKPVAKSCGLPIKQHARMIYPPTCG